MELDILYEDQNIIVCHKPAGLATQTARVGQRDMVSEITGYLARQQGGGKVPYVGIVHRLDQPVEGIIVFAKEQRSAAELCRQMTADEMGKYYDAVVCGRKIPPKGELTDFLLKDSRTNTSGVVSKETKGAKLARLIYEVRTKSECKVDQRIEPCLLGHVRIHLLTGRHHQIRVQMANAGMPLLGDYKYGNPDTKELSENLQIREIALCASELYFRHPVTGRKLEFRIEPQGKVFRMMCQNAGIECS